MSILTIASATAFLVLYCIVFVLWVKTMKLTESRAVKLVPGGKGSHQEEIDKLTTRELEKHIPPDNRFSTNEDLEKIKVFAWSINKDAKLMDGNHDNWQEEDSIRREIAELLKLFDTIREARKLTN